MMHGRCIMVVEDSDEDFETVRDAARRSGLPHNIVRATSGDECMRLLREPQLSRYAMPLLVILDLNTPNDDGRDVLREIRADTRLKTLPLVVLSGSDNPRDLQFCYGCGANAYHVKPVDHALHLRVLQEIFHYWLGSVKLPV
jgi:two-component system, response regulator